MHNHDWPWQVVIEIAKQNRRLTYPEIHRATTQLMRSTMVFYNHCLEGETLSTIVALPFDIKI